MALLTYVTGDLTTVSEGYVLHGCNAQGRYRSGVAGAIRQAHPWAWKAYDDAYRTKGLTLGTIIMAVSPDSRLTVLNAITQQFYGYDGKRYVSYHALAAVFRSVAADPAIEHVSMPLIGAALGGGHWPDIARIAEENLGETRATVYLLDGRIPA